MGAATSGNAIASGYYTVYNTRNDRPEGIFRPLYGQKKAMKRPC